MKTRYLRFLIHAAALAILLLVCTSIYISVRLDESGLWVLYEHMWSDFPLHLAIAKSFELNKLSNWLAFHPFYAELPLTYPFMMDLLSGLLLRFNVGLEKSFYIPAIVLLVSFFFLLRLIGKEISQNALTGSVAFVFFILGAGLEGLYRALIWPRNEAFSTSMTRIEEYNWYSGNIVDGFLLPQRTVILGLAMMSVEILGLLKFLRQNVVTPPLPQMKHERITLSLLGIGLGLMPIVHAHACFATAVFLVVVFCMSSRRVDLSYFAVPALIVGFLVIKNLTAHSLRSGSYFIWYPGWSAKEHLWEWPWMWFRIFGFAIPFLIISGRWWWQYSATTRAIGMWYLGLFTFANLFLLQPVVWDNSKIFFFSYLGICLLLAAWALENLPKNSVKKTLFCLSLFIVFCGSGSLDFLRLITTHGRHQVTSPEEIEIGKVLSEITPPLSRFLTAPVHNHFVMAWSGRPIVSGFTPWLNNFGVDGNAVQKDEEMMLAHPANSQHLFLDYKPDYVVLSSYERHVGINEDFFLTCCATVYQSRSGIRVIDVRSLRQSR